MTPFPCTEDTLVQLTAADGLTAGGRRAHRGSTVTSPIRTCDSSRMRLAT